MPRFSPSLLAAFSLVFSFSLTACSSSVSTAGAPMEKVAASGTPNNGVNDENGKPVGQGGNALRGATANMHEGDMATMEAVSNGCLKGWRKACDGDEKGALAILNDLDKHYPGVLTIQMMLGQVYEHFGQTKEAIEHYRKCVTGNEFSSFHMFKLAEAMRKNGDNKGAAVYYRKVIKYAPEFGAASIGLAKCLLAEDKNSAEARTLLSNATKDKEAAKEAQKMLDEIEPGAKAGN